MTEDAKNTPREPDALPASAHAHLDGDSSLSNAAAFERDLRADAVLDRRVAALRGMETWLQATRPRTPSLLASAVEHALEAERVSAGEAGSPAAARGRILPLPPRRSGLWAGMGAGLAAAAAVAILVLGPLAPDRTPDQPGRALADTIEHRFLLRAPDAREVCLAGDFNLWKVCDTRLEPLGEGLWSVSMELPRGRHEYMFVVDGRWMTDPRAVVTVDDGFGNRNAVLTL